MLHAVHYPRELLTERITFTPADYAQIARCRGASHRLGLAYQLGFLRLTGRFPAQQPLELLHDVLVFVAHAVAIEPAAIHAYAQRRQTVSEHQHLLQRHLGLRAFGSAEREALGRFLREEALRLESTPALMAQAETFLRARQILVPAVSTLRRLVGEQRERARLLVSTRMMAVLPPAMPARLERLLHVAGDDRHAPLHGLKTAPGAPTPQALHRLTATLDLIQETGVLTLDLTWLNPNLQKVLARHAGQASVHRLERV